MAGLTLDDLFASPDHFLHAFEGDDALFVPMDDAAYRRSIFLDHRIDPAGAGTLRLPLKLLVGRAAKPAATGWIFHVAHCGSTLLARALDSAVANLVLREPLALRQVALAPDPARIDLVFAMLGKRYETARPTVVKANVPVNFLLPAIAARDPAAPAILLHLSLADYVRAILRTGQHRGWLRRVTGQLAGHLGDLSALSDAALVAALWLAQMRAFAGAMAAMPNARSLDAETFFAEPAETLARAAAHLGVPLDCAAAARTVAGPLFATYSKNPDQPFDNAARLDRQAAMEAALAGEIASAEAWAAHQGDVTALTAAVAAARL